MEYYGKTLCVSARDLTRDDRTADDCSERLAPVISYSSYEKLVQRNKIVVVRQGKGKGSYALVEWDSLSRELQWKYKQKYGAECVVNTTHNRMFSDAYVRDAGAHAYYHSSLRGRNKSLSPEKLQQRIEQYIVNYSVLQTVLRLTSEIDAKRKARGMKPLSLKDAAIAMNYYRETLGHTLPKTPSKLSALMKRFASETGDARYEVVVKDNFGNENATKVTHEMQQLIMSLDSQKFRPYNKTVAEMYRAFIAGKITLYDPETGEYFDPSAACYAKRISDRTIANILTTPMADSVRSLWHDGDKWWNDHKAPHHDRKSAHYSLSKISLDDRDLPIKVKDGNQLVFLKVYLAYDVASQALIGYAFGTKKTRALVIECLRHTFSTLDSLGLGVPYEAEVENHLMRDMQHDVMAKGALFPYVSWCLPQNSQQKRAEHFNRMLKYGVEKRQIPGTGRWWARSSANRRVEQKVFDEENDRYKQEVYRLEDAIALFTEIFRAYNADPHTNKKRYGGRSRWEVLQQCANKEIQPIDFTTVARLIGWKVDTSVQRMHVRANHRLFSMTAEQADRMRAGNTGIEVCWWETAEGDMHHVTAYQGGVMIGELQQIVAYQEAIAEQTEEDRRLISEQSQRVAAYRKAVKDRLPMPIGIIKTEAHEQIEERRPLAVLPLPRDKDEIALSQYAHRRASARERAINDL